MVIKYEAMGSVGFGTWKSEMGKKQLSKEKKK